jgi:hypothetical protein
MDKRSVPKESVSVFLIFVCVAGCGGTWVDDPGNFKRVFGFRQPDDVRVLHSYYWKSPHWTTEYSYFIAVQPSSTFVSGLTSSELMTSAKPEPKLLESCGTRPQWFLPKPLASYEAWLPKTQMGYRAFRDRTDGTLFVCGQQL